MPRRPSPYPPPDPLSPQQRLGLLLLLIVLLFAGLICVGLIAYDVQQHLAAQSVPQQPLPPSGQPLPPAPQQPQGPSSVQMLLGNPSGATPDPSNCDNYLMLKPYYALGYNDTRGEPNWVSWQVTAEDLGDAPRKQVFDPDDTLPGGFRRVQTREYAGSGFDRGHMCPHSDRAANVDMSYSTFCMSNIIPQAPQVNQQAWARLEDLARDLAREGNHLYVTSGPCGQGGVGRNGPADTLAGGVVVPATCWKIVVVVPPGGGDDLTRVSSACRVIAVMMPNRQGMGEDWRPFACTVADIEQRTGYRFFGALPPDVAAALKTKRDTGGR